MGCFLGCFGFSSKRKRRKPANKLISGNQKHISYEPLDSYVSINLDTTENPRGSDSELRNKPKEQLRIKVKKKVSFNLNVQAYEPIPNDETTYHSWESDEEEKKEKTSEETAKGDSAALRMGAYPSNYRYQNCTDSYDDEDELPYEESDLDDDYDDDEDDYDDEDDGDYLIDDQRISQEEFSKQFNSLSMELQKRDSLIELAEDKTNNHLPLSASTDREVKSIELNGNARDRSKYVHSVLIPVENLTQWKAVKAKAAPPKHQRKENIALDLSLFNAAPNYNQSRPLLQEIAVDTSLSNWLAMLNSKEIKTESIKSRSISVNTISSQKCMFERSYSWRSREDIPILDITNLEA